MHEPSEVAQLRQRIALECQAGWAALHALNSGAAQHEFIRERFKQMEKCHERLTELVGEERATDILCEEYDREGRQKTLWMLQYHTGSQPSIARFELFYAASGAEARDVVEKLQQTMGETICTELLEPAPHGFMIGGKIYAGTR